MIAPKEKAETLGKSFAITSTRPPLAGNSRMQTGGPQALLNRDAS